MDPAGVFEGAYRGRDPDELSWHQAEPFVSLELLDLLGVAPDRSLVDVGGGASPLAARLLERGFADLTVLDVSTAALAAAQSLLGPRAGEVTRLVQDVRAWRPERRFDVWHDRATLHFLVEPADRDRYLDAFDRALADDGVAVLATFAPDGPDLLGTARRAVRRGRPRRARTWTRARRRAARAPSHTPRRRAAVHVGGTAAGPLRSSRRCARRSTSSSRRRGRGSAALTPGEAHAAAAAGALIVDIRADLDRERAGVVPGSLHVPRTVLEWRLDPGSPWRSPHAPPLDRPVILICDHGYSSSLAAATLVELGFADAGDVIGGFEAWREAGLPVAGAPSARAPGMLAGMAPSEAES